MNKKLLILSIAAILAAPSAFAAYIIDATPTANTTSTDDARDLQNVIVTVPEVALLDVADTDVAIPTLTPPTDAGEGFPGIDTGAAVSSSSTFSLSSNVKATAPVPRTLNVAVKSGSVPAGGTLKIVASGAGTDGETSVILNTPTGSAATAINNVVTKSGIITYKFGATTDKGMIAYTGTDGTTGDTIELAYTLSDD